MVCEDGKRSSGVGPKIPLYENPHRQSAFSVIPTYCIEILQIKRFQTTMIPAAHKELRVNKIYVCYNSGMEGNHAYIVGRRP